MALFDKLFRRESGVQNKPPQEPEQQPGSEQQKLPFDTWMVVKGADMQSIVHALGLSDPAPCGWEDGCQKLNASPGTLLVTEPVEGYCFVIGSSLPNLAYHARASAKVADFAKHFELVHFFSASKNADTYFFASLEKGTYLRAYAAAQGEVKINKGEMTEAEKNSALRFPKDDDELFEGGPEITRLSLQAMLKLAEACGISAFAAFGHSGMIGKIERQ